ncbi:MAG: hypothetical protein GQ540_02480 [Lutibacter sp.]|uniref:hypothetical protein n=1 Tax=Lutibacter sp. TaxID=1925666 RepID=UPI0019DFAE6A|nr:hypothetical protein [Lutibacter sp.]NOR27374.1 hypothetical protein [Lutibacter sp.]
MVAFFNFLTVHATKRNIRIGVLLILLFNILLLPEFSKLFSENNIKINAILDLKFSYTINEAYLLIENLGENGRNTYKYKTLFIDFPYALMYSFVYAFIIIMLLNTTTLKRINYVCLAPFFISWFDVLENSGIILMLLKYPTKLTAICNLTSIFTSLKWIFAAITFLIIVTLFINLIYSKTLKKN